jgi:hypothetical protein
MVMIREIRTCETMNEPFVSFFIRALTNGAKRGMKRFRLIPGNPAKAKLLMRLLRLFYQER